jgi:hypothetical protein
MTKEKIMIYLVLGIGFFSALASLLGILSLGSDGGETFTSFRGFVVELYGQGIYKDMSFEVALQGIAQDFVTLLLAVPTLLISFVFAKKGYKKARLVLIGVTTYIFLTYLFYIAMSMYNPLFLVYALLLSMSFFLLILTLTDPAYIGGTHPQDKTPLVKRSAIFLIVVSSVVTLVWLMTLLSPLREGTLYPVTLEHYTTLIVQAFDLSLFLPSIFIIGLLTLKKNPLGYKLLTPAVVFITFIMINLSAKFIMMMPYQDVIPLLSVTAVFAVFAGLHSYLLIESLTTV